LTRPKLVKGPDLFAEILIGLQSFGFPVHVLLAGPRRHWLRSRLIDNNIPFTFVGSLTDKDDIDRNILPRERLNELYGLLDLYLVTSRSEGGPHSILEASAAQCKVASTPVGIATDILDARCIFTHAHEAISLIGQDIHNDWLSETVSKQASKIRDEYSFATQAKRFADLYSGVSNIPVFEMSSEPMKYFHVSENRLTRRLRLMGHRLGLKRKKPGLTVGLWHTFYSPPYGGGNQFMLALRKGLKERHINVVENILHEYIDAYLLNSIHFDVESFLRFSQEHPPGVVHRIDGPIHLIRGTDRDKDDLCFELNHRFASSTILQSNWTYQRIVEMGYEPVRPVIVHNAADPEIFHPRGRIEFNPDRKIRLIASSWSDNPRKGGPVYKWMDRNLDWDRFEFTFVGRVSEQLDNIRLVDAVPSHELAALLRQHDIYVTASQNDPCSNSLIEALSCGLPALFFNDGGHPELVGYGGLPFNEPDEIPSQLDSLVEHYLMYQNLIDAPDLDQVLDKYLELLTDAGGRS
ncbi:MAG: glycosyltransferase, partial [bacterium]